MSASDSLMRFRRVRVPNRVVGGRIVAARPDADEAVVLGGASAVVWLELHAWRTETDIQEAVSGTHPEVPAAERVALVGDALRMLCDEGLVERRDG